MLWFAKYYSAKVNLLWHNNCVEWLINLAQPHCLVAKATDGASLALYFIFTHMQYLHYKWKITSTSDWKKPKKQQKLLKNFNYTK